MGKSGKKGAQQTAAANQKYFDEFTRSNRARQEALGGQIDPFIQLLLSFGKDPLAFLRSPQGQALLAPIQQAIGKNFAGARESAVDLFAGQGFSPSAGVAQGPLANLFSQEAGAQSNAIQQLIAQSLGYGVQGAQLGAGQQQIFNPLGPAGISLGYNQAILGQQPSGILGQIGQLLGGVGSTITGIKS